MPALTKPAVKRSAASASAARKPAKKSTAVAGRESVALRQAVTAALAAIRAARAIVITTHLNPDGDGIGTGLALAHALRRLGKRVLFACPGTPASLYGFLPGFDRIRAIADDAAGTALGAEKPLADLVISCDCGDLKRLGPVAATVAAVRARGGKLLNLDHHATNDRFGDLNLVDVAGESSGVVADVLLRRLGVAYDRVLATCLYTTIVFDTGRFMHSNTTPRCLRWTADLMDTGIDAAALNRALTYTRTPQDLCMQRLALEHLAVDTDPRLAGIALSRTAIEAVGEPEDWGDLVELPRSLRGNQIAYILRETKSRDAVRASLRSNPPFAVAGVAQRFGGGGHAQAAGCTIPGDLATAQAALLPLLRAALG